MFPALAGRFFTTSATWEALNFRRCKKYAIFAKNIFSVEHTFWPNPHDPMERAVLFVTVK